MTAPIPPFGPHDPLIILRERTTRELVAYERLGVLDYVSVPRNAETRWVVGAAGRDVVLEGDAAVESFLEGCRAVAVWAHAALPPLTPRPEG